MFRTLSGWQTLLFIFSVGVLLAMGGASILAYERQPSPNAVMRGYYLAQEMGCFACHGPGGIVGHTNQGSLWGETPPFKAGGPIMSFIQDDNDIREWIMYGAPRRLWVDEKKPQEGYHKVNGTRKDWDNTHGVGGIIKMPAYEGLFSEVQLDDLVAYVKETAELTRPMPADAEAGRQVASKFGCFGCHGVNGRGGVSNPGSFKGYIPPWDGGDFAALVENEQELRDWILNGKIERFENNPLAAYFTGGQIIKMPAFKSVIDAKELDDLVSYIDWLRDDDKVARRYWVDKEAEPFVSVVDRGKWLYHRVGCAACHGPDGIGGVPNQNASGGFVPELIDMAEKLELFEPEDVAKILALFENGVHLDRQNIDTDIAEFDTVQQQYISYRDFIITGGNPGKSRGSKGPPGMVMPAWKYRLYADGSPTSRADVDAVIAYLLTLQEF